MNTIVQWAVMVLGLALVMVIVWFLINPPKDDALDRGHADPEDERDAV